MSGTSDTNEGASGTDEVLAGVGPRLRRIRKEREATLAGLSEATGISVSTLSRLESGLRKPSLELLLPIARAHQVPLDELIGEPPVGDPRVRSKPIQRHGRTYWPLTRQPGGLQAFKVRVEPQGRQEPEPRTHEGYEWLYVMSGKLRVVLGEHDVVMVAGRPPSSTPGSRIGSARRGRSRWSSSVCSGRRGSGCMSGPGPHGRDARYCVPTVPRRASDRLVCMRQSAPGPTKQSGAVRGGTACRHGKCTRTASRAR